MKVPSINMHMIDYPGMCRVQGHVTSLNLVNKWQYLGNSTGYRHSYIGRHVFT